MTYLSLRDFLDVATKTGEPRITKVRNIKHADEYSPVIDFYKPLRQGIVSAHRAGKSKQALSGLLSGIGDKRKLANYPLAIAGYDAWWGAHQLKWFDPPKGKYSKYGFEISINPELGLEIDGSPHVIKLYLNTAPLPSYRAAARGADDARHWHFGTFSAARRSRCPTGAVRQCNSQLSCADKYR